MRIAASTLLLACLASAGNCALTHLVLDKPSYVGGSDFIEGVVLLDANAPSGGTVVSISDTSSGVISPSSVTVPAGQRHAAFSCTTPVVSSVTTRAISASLGAVTRTSLFALTPTSRPLSITITPAEIQGGDNATISVELDHPMANSGASMTFTDNSSAITLNFAEVFASRGIKFVSNTAFTSAVGTAATRQITASCNGVTRTGSLTLRPRQAIAAFTPTDGVIVGGQPFNLTVLLSGFQRLAGNTISVSSSSASVVVPPTFFAAGGNGLTTANTNTVTAPQLVVITATLYGASRTCTVLVVPSAGG